jgi:hypothetical protein
MSKIIVEPAYYELKVRKAKEFEEVQYFQGVGNMFAKRTNLFDSLERFENHREKMKFDDSVIYHQDLEDEYTSIYPDFFMDNEFKRSDDGKWFWL